MNILVTGGAGYIGGTLTRLLLAAGHQVTVFDNFCHSRRTAVPPAATLVQGDLSDRKLIEATLSAGQPSMASCTSPRSLKLANP